MTRSPNPRILNPSLQPPVPGGFRAPRWLLLVLSVCWLVSVEAADYTYVGTGAFWADPVAWSPVAGVGGPGAGDNINYVSTGTTQLWLSGTFDSSPWVRDVNTIAKTGSGRLDIGGNSSTGASTLNAQLISSTVGALVFRDAGAGGLTVNAGNLSVVGTGNLNFGLNSLSTASTLRALNVSGTTTVNTASGFLALNVVNSNTNSYSLGHLVVDAGGVYLNRAPTGKSLTIANVTGLSGAGGIIQNSDVSGTNNISNLFITNSADFTSATVLRDNDAGNTSEGTLSLTKAGVGTQTLTGANTYSGGTTINQGVLQVNNDANLGAAAGSLTFGGGTLAFTSGTTTVNRATTLNAGGGTVRVNSNNSLVSWSGVVSGSGALTKTGTAATQSVLHLTGTNTYTGGTVLEAGIIRISEDVNLGDASGGLTFNNGSNTARLITSQSMTSNRQIILNGNGVIATEQLVPETPNITTWNGVISGTGSLEKRFAGTLLLTADNTYTGATTVTTGSLLVGSGGTGSLATSGVTVAAGALLGGSGEIDGAVTVNGFLAPGNSPGTLTINNSLTLNGTATALMEIGGTGAGQFDQIALTGTLTLDGTIAVTLIDGFDPTAGNSFDLFTGYTGPIVDNGVVFDFSGATLDPGLSWDTSNFLTTGVINVVPEPSTGALLGLGLMALAWRARVRQA